MKRRSSACEENKQQQQRKRARFTTVRKRRYLCVADCLAENENTKRRHIEFMPTLILDLKRHVGFTPWHWRATSGEPSGFYGLTPAHRNWLLYSAEMERRTRRMTLETS